MLNVGIIGLGKMGLIRHQAVEASGVARVITAFEPEPVSFELMQTNWANRFLAADIRRRNSDGGFSFELYQNENLFDIRNDDDWLLLPSGKNLDALRVKMAFDMNSSPSKPF